MTTAPYFIPEELQLKQNAGMIDPVAFAEGELAELRNPSYDFTPKDLAKHLALACTMILMFDAALKRKLDDEPTVQEMIDNANREAANWTRGKDHGPRLPKSFEHTTEGYDDGVTPPPVVTLREGIDDERHAGVLAARLCHETKPAPPPGNPSREPMLGGKPLPPPSKLHTKAGLAPMFDAAKSHSDINDLLENLARKIRHQRAMWTVSKGENDTSLTLEPGQRFVRANDIPAAHKPTSNQGKRRIPPPAKKRAEILKRSVGPVY